MTLLADRHCASFEPWTTTKLLLFLQGCEAAVVMSLFASHFDVAFFALAQVRSLITTRLLNLSSTARSSARDGPSTRKRGAKKNGRHETFAPGGRADVAFFPLNTDRINRRIMLKKIGHEHLYFWAFSLYVQSCPTSTRKHTRFADIPQKRPQSGRRRFWIGNMCKQKARTLDCGTIVDSSTVFNVINFEFCCRALSQEPLLSAPRFHG